MILGLSEASSGSVRRRTLRASLLVRAADRQNQILHVSGPETCASTNAGEDLISMESMAFTPPCAAQHRGPWKISMI